MHILLTDVLTCPRCGPQFGLVVLADRLEDRQVMEGRLGCANCRESYPVEAGVADLRVPAGPSLEPLPGYIASADQAFRAAALMGVRSANTSVLLVEPQGEVAAAVAEFLPDVHVLAATADPPAKEWPERGTLSRIRVGARLPLRSRSIAGAAALGVRTGPMLDDLRRALAPGARLVVDPAPAGLAESLAAAGFTVLLEQDGVTVAAAPEPR